MYFQPRESMTSTPVYALVTGAGKGLGQAFARELAVMKKNLILVSLPGEGLEEQAKEFRNEYGIDVVFYETDFLKNENIKKLGSWINENYSLEILINNAGIGGSCSFTEASAEYIETIIRLNIEAPTLLLHQLLPNLLQRNKAWILNVASMACFTPIGYKTVYPASKRFLQHFSAGLHEELRGTGVSISCVYPGPMKTNNTVSTRIERYGIWGRMILLTPQEVASKSIQKMLKNKKNIVLGWPNKIYRFMMTSFPAGIVLKVATRAVKKELIREKEHTS